MKFKQSVSTQYTEITLAFCTNPITEKENHDCIEVILVILMLNAIELLNNWPGDVEKILRKNENLIIGNNLERAI